MSIRKTIKALKQIDNQKQNFQLEHKKDFLRHSSKEWLNRLTNPFTKVEFALMQK